MLEQFHRYAKQLRELSVIAIMLPSVALAGVDLVVNNTDTPDPIVAGGVVTYTVRVTNDSITGTAATSVTTTHAVSAGAIYQGATGPGVSCTGMSIGQAGPATLNCTLPDLAPGGGEVIFTIQLKSTVLGNISLGATAASIEADDAAANNTLNQSTTVNAGANLAMLVTPGSATVISGATFSWSLVIGNSGPDAASNLVVQTPVPTGFSVTGIPSGCSNSAGTITCNVAGPIASGGSLTLGNLTGQIIAAGGSTVTSTTTVAVSGAAPPGTPQDPDAGNNTAVANITVTPGSDLKITKARSLGGNLTIGQSFNFVLTPTYSGGTPSSLTVTDVVPVNYTVGAVAASQNGWACSVAGQTVSCTKASGGVAGLNQALGVITIPVTVATAGANVINTTAIASVTPDPNLANNTASDGGVNLLNPTVDLTVAKSGPNPALVVQGVPFNYSVSARNGSTSTSVYFGTVTVTDSLPAGLTVNSYTLNGWACLPAAPVVGPASIACSRTYTAGAPLAIGASTPAVVLNVTATATGTINNGVTITATCNLGAGNCGDGDTANYVVTSSTAPSSADIRVLKTVVGPNPVAAGDVLTYTLEVVNDGPDVSTAIVLTDTLTSLINNGAGPTGSGYVGQTITASLASGASCSTVASGGTGRRLTCNFATLPVCVAGSNCPVVTIQVRPGGSGGNRSNTANVISNGTADPNHANETASVTSTVDPRADVTVAKTANPSPVLAGQNLTYVVTATNVANGLSPAANVTITDTLPLNVTFISASPSAGSCVTTPGANVITTAGNRTVSCNLATINNGSQRTVTIVVRPNTVTRGTTIVNDVVVTTSTTETNGSNNSATISVPVNNPRLDLVLNKVDTVDPVAVGDVTAYTITITNSGPSAAENVVMTDPLTAAGLSFQSVVPSAGGSCPTQPAVDSLGGTASCNLGYMPAGTTRIVALNMKGVLKGIYTNTASVTSDEVVAGFDTNAPNNTASETTTVRTKADMAVVSKVATPATVNVRDDFNFVIKVRNNVAAGLGEADGVIVSDTLPSGMELTGTPTISIVTGTITTATCTGTAASISFTCDFGTVSPGAVVDITVPVQLVTVTSLTQSFTNTASVSSTSFDVNLANNSNTGTVSVNSGSIAGRVFRDFNNDGLVTAGDTGISGITLTLSGTAFDGAAISRTAVTDASGNYIFIGVPQGTYQVVEGAVAETNLNDGIDTVGTIGGLPVGSNAVNDTLSGIALPANTVAAGYNFAEAPVARIGAAKAVQGAITINGDGTFSTTFRLLIKNLGLETLNSITVTDVLNGAAPKFGSFVAGGAAAVLANGNYTLQTAPSGSCGGLNSGFDGSGNIGVATLPSLAAGASCTIDFTVRVYPTAPLPVVSGLCGGRYCNQASATGTGALSGQVPADLSDNGSNPDPNNNGIGNEAGENDPTPVSPTFGPPSINLVKTLNTGVSVQPDNTILVPVRLVVSNSGSEPLSAVSVTDSLSAAATGPFGVFVAGGAGAVLTSGQYTVQTAPTFSGACANGTATAAFTGHTGNTQVASISAMTTAATCTIDFAYRFMPLAGTSYTNQAAASGTSDFTATPVNKNSSAPVPYPRVGIAKQVVVGSTINADGTATVPFSLVIRNLGGETLNAVTVTDTLSGVAPAFGTYVPGGAAALLTAGQYTVQTAPAFSGACTNGTANAAYTGAAVATVATMTSMAGNASCTVLFSLRLRPSIPLPAVSGLCGSRYCNQASVSGTGAASGLAVSDLSANGANPDLNGNGFGGDAGENGPTPVTLSFVPRIGLAKAKSSAEVVNANGTVTVAFRIKVQNYGDEALTNIQVGDTIAGAAPRFGTYVAGGAGAALNNGQYTIQVAPSINGACAAATLTGGFSGSSGSAQLASLTRLERGELCQFDLTLRYKATSPIPVGGYANQANTAGTGDFSGTVVTDLSNNGTNPDSNGNGDPTDDNTPTPVSSTYTAGIGIAKALQAGLIASGNGTYAGTFRMLVKNFGNEEINNVSITDAMNGVAPRFGAFVAGGPSATLGDGKYTILGAPVFVGACAGGTPNAGFDGSGTTLVASITQLPIDGSCTLEFSFRFHPQPGASYSNQAVASGTGAFSAGVVTDLSDDGANPDSNGNGVGNEPSENDPTPVPIQRIGLAKMAGAVVNNGDGTYNVPFTLSVDNAGQTALASVQITDTAAGQFGVYTAGVPAAGQYTIVGAPTISDQTNGSALTAVAAGAFTGSGGANALLVPGASSLPNFGAGSASRAQVQFTLRFFPTTAGPFSNSAMTTGTPPVGGSVTDDSADGANSDPNGNGDPGDDTSPTMVSFSAQAIGLAKSVAGVVQTGAKRFRVHYRLAVQNVSATVTATNVQVTDNLTAVFPTAQSLTLSVPAAVSSCTGTALNLITPPFNGVGQSNLLIGNQNLQPGERCVITFAVDVDFGANALPATAQSNQANAITAQTSGGTVIATDLSNDGVNPDPNGNHIANEAGENTPTPVSFDAARLAAISGKVYLDRNHDRIDNDGFLVPAAVGFIVEVLNGEGQIIGTTTTAADGTYTVGGLYPSTPGNPATYYTVRFREPISGAVYGISQSVDPTIARNGVVVNGQITQLQLAPGVTTINQSLPLDPGGVVYDSVTRDPIADAIVALMYGGVPVPTACLVGAVNSQMTGATGMYQFLLINPVPPGCPGSGTYTIEVTQPAGYLPPPSDTIPPGAGPHVPPSGGVEAIQTQAGPPAIGQPTTYYFSLTLTPGVSADVVNNHIPLDPIRGGVIVMTKSTPLVNVVRSDLVPYTITATNTLSATLKNINVVDVIPAGFRYRTGSAMLDGAHLEPVVNGRSLTWPNHVFGPGERKTWRMLLVVGSGVSEGIYVNQVSARSGRVNAQLSNMAEASVRVVPDPAFDCSDIIGKVFDDKNANGYQDSDEPGIANVRIATARGLLVTTDAEGRFHVACAAIPNADRGANFVMKIDERTLPSGYRLTTENPRDVRVTRGKMVKLEFGATVHRVIRLELSGAAFVADGTDLQASYIAQLEKLPTQLALRPSVLRIAYRRGNEPTELARRRLEVITARIQALWQQTRKKTSEEGEPLHPLMIETELEAAQ